MGFSSARVVIKWIESDSNRFLRWFPKSYFAWFILVVVVRVTKLPMLEMSRYELAYIFLTFFLDLN